MKPTYVLGIALIAMSSQPSTAATQTRSGNVPTLDEEVVVTATRRSENVRDIPANVGVFQGEALDEKAAKSFDDFLPSMPGVSLIKTDPQQSTIIIRGISTSTGVTQTQQPTGVYIDEMPFTDPFSFFSVPDLTPFDLERVEVLRGPQGTLYGSGALGGAVRLITRKPDLARFGGGLSVEGSSTSGSDGLNSLVQGMVNLPLKKDVAGVRLVASRLKNAGYVDNAVTGREDWNSYDQTSGRLLFKWAASDALEVNASAVVQETNLDGSSVMDEGSGLVEAQQARADQRNRYEMFNANAEWRTSVATLFASSTYGVKQNKSVIDAGPQLSQLTATGIAGALGAALGIPAPPLTASQFLSLDSRRSESWAHEIRATSTGAGRWKWLAGAFYQKTTSDLSGQTTSLPGLGAQLDLLFPGLSNSFVLTGDRFFQLNDGSGQKSKERAVFGEIGYAISDTVDVVVGGRYFDIKTATGINIIVPGLPGGIPINTGYVPASDSGFNPKVSIAWRPSGAVMIYALASKGYRVGGTNVQTVLGTTRTPTTFGSDKLWNYEIGAKSTWFGGRLTLDATAFYLDWKNIQLEGLFFSPDLGRFVSETRNAGAAHSVGLEASLNVQVTTRLFLESSVAVIEAKTDDDSSVFINPFTRAPTTVRKGSELPGTPNFQVANTVRYEWPLTQSVDARILLMHTYFGRSSTSIAVPAQTSIGDYHNFGVRFALARGPIDVAVFVSNLTDERGVTFRTPGSVPGFLPNKVSYLTPRTIGLTANYRF